MNHSCYFKKSGRLEQRCWISCSFRMWLKITDEKGQQVFWLQNDWQWKTVSSCLFFQLIDWFSVELCYKSFALKNRFGNEASSPYPRKHFFLGKTFDACMLLAHKLEDLGMFTYNSLQAAYYLSPFLHLSFFCLICNNLCLEGSSQQQVEGGSFFKMFKGWVSSIKNRIWPKSYFFWCVFWGKVMITCSYPLLLTLALPICCYLFFTSRVWPLRFWSFTNPWLTQVTWYSFGSSFLRQSVGVESVQAS